MVNHNFFDSKWHEKEMREAAERNRRAEEERQAAEAATQIVEISPELGAAATGTEGQIQPVDTAQSEQTA